MVDHENTAGFGRDAVVAVMTQQQDGVQRQSLFYSTDDGHTFTAYGGTRCWITRVTQTSGIPKSSATKRTSSG